MWNKLLKLISSERVRAESRPLTLPEYVASLADVALPTAVEMERFAVYVAHSHSWYKHLPLCPPGNRFYFFLDKYAGWDRLVSSDGTGVFAERTEPGFHYSAIPTAEYRTKFGCLAYSCDSGSTVIPLGKGPVAAPRDKSAAVGSQDGQMRSLPPEVLEAGETWLTGVIHGAATAQNWWELVIPRHAQWPQESGGQEILEKIIARCREMKEPGFERKWRAEDDGLPEEDSRTWMYVRMGDPVLNELMSPERKRQHGEMVKAMSRACDLIRGLRP